jgi:hypothetical protein
MNAVTAESEHLFVADIADCLICGATLPEGWPTIESDSPNAATRYRVCRECAFFAAMCHAAGGEMRAQWRAELKARLHRLGLEIRRGSIALVTAKPQRIQ